jgi:hypothetical protein
VEEGGRRKDAMKREEGGREEGGIRGEGGTEGLTKFCYPSVRRGRRKEGGRRRKEDEEGGGRETRGLHLPYLVTRERRGSFQIGHWQADHVPQQTQKRTRGQQEDMQTFNFKMDTPHFWD